MTDERLEGGELEALTDREKRLGQEAKTAFSEGRNPAAWVADEDLWEKAKEVVDPEGVGEEKYEDPWAVVVHVYQQMGGRIADGATVAREPRATLSCRSEGVPLRARKEWAVGRPVEIQWMPGGVRTITASYGRGREFVPVEITLACDPQTAEVVQSSLDHIKAANPRRPPYGCIEHRAEERAFDPIRFMWKETPEPGVYCLVEPSELGARNVNGRVHTSFSPTFDTDADYKQMFCSGCGGDLTTCHCAGRHVFRFKTGARGSPTNPARVTSLDAQSVGSLTNWPAFKDILPVNARGQDRESIEASGNEVKIEEEDEQKRRRPPAGAEEQEGRGAKQEEDEEEGEQIGAANPVGLEARRAHNAALIAALAARIPTSERLWASGRVAGPIETKAATILRRWRRS